MALINKNIQYLFIIIFLSIIFIFASNSIFYLKNIVDLRNSWQGLVLFSSGAFIGMLLLPILTIKLIFKDKLENFGWKLPENLKEATFLIFISIMVLMPIIYFFSGLKSFQNYYLIKEISPTFLLLTFFLSLFYYIAEEFLFRGFLFFGLLHKIGYHSFWITSLLFSFFHLTKPMPEILFAFLTSFLFCYLSLKTKSFIPAVIVHYFISLSLNILMFINQI